MTDRSLKTLSVAAAVAGAVSLTAALVPSDAEAQGREKCYGVAKAGENGCASADGAHSCAGQSTVDFSGQEWKLVASGSCESMGGNKEPFAGLGEMANQG